MKSALVLFSIGTAALFFAGLVCVTVGFYWQFKMLKYLQREKPARWEFLTTNLTWLGPGMRNAKRLFDYVRNQDDMEDMVIREYKFRLRRLMTYAGVCAGAGFVCSVMLGFMSP